MDGDENGMSGEDEEKENEDGDAEELHLVEGKFYQDPKYNLSGIISHTWYILIIRYMIIMVR